MYEENYPNYPYLNFPSPLLPDEVHDLFLGNVLPYPSPPPPPPPMTTDVIRAKGKGKRKADTTTTTSTSGGGKQKRRRGKTDRHSKIHTAKGPRDRRMRLSLQIARKFFDLQDMLGFDKASKTIEWLFNKSKSAIKDLTHGNCTSDTLAPLEQPVNGGNGKVDNGNISTNEKKNKEKGKVVKGELLFQVMRGNREKARARARERTKEKKLLMIQKQQNDQNPNCSISTIRVGQSHDYGCNYINNDHHEQQHIALEDQMASIGIIEKYLTTSSSSTLFDFDHNNCDTMIGPSHEMINFAGFPANWISQSSNQPEIQNTNYASFMGNPYN